ncbi:MAG TPA: hypothetical protein VKU02_22490, partial [Gemmataceae bacterium]|nr:hypothetical protein [Gemmataceae bacterium]
MFTLLKSFGKNVASRRRKTPLQARPAIEAMEERLVPTVAFKPVFNGEAVYPFPSGYLKDGDIYPIYWGSGWQNIQAAENQLDFALSQVVDGYGGDFFRGLDQYAGGDASASYNARRTDTSAAPSTVFTNFPWGDPVMDEAHKLMNNGTVPNPGQTKPFPPIYVVITDPSVTMNGANGFNEPGSLNFDHWIVWVSTNFQLGSSTTLNLDFSTQVFSHELAEVITAPSTGTRVKPGSTFPGNTTAGSAEDPGQIADNEPNNNYVYRIGGPSGQLVQAYWSNSSPDAGYYIVTDDNTYNMEIDPNPWTLNGNNLLAFSGGTLVVNTNQPGVPANQDFSIDTVQMPTGTGMQVIMDGDRYDFEPGQITSIQLDTANDSESIQVNSTLPNVPVTITLGSGTYQVNINSSQSSVSVNNNQGGNAVVQIDGSINGAVGVNNTNGGSLDVQLGTSGGLSQIQAAVLVTGGGAATIEANDQNNANDTSFVLNEALGSHLTMSGNPNFSLSYIGVATFALSGGEGNDRYDLTHWQPGLNEQQVKITAGGSTVLTGGSGRNTVLGPDMPTTWYLNTPSSGYATFAGTQRLTCSWAGAKSITLVGGSSARDLAGNTFYVEATGVPTSIYTGNSNDTVYVGGSGSVTSGPNQFALDSLDPIQATLYVDGQGGSNTVNLEDKAAAAGENYTLDSSTLNRSGAAVITYVNIQTLMLQCGIHGNHIDVEGTHTATNTTINSGTGTNTVSLANTGENLDLVQGPLTLNDPGTDTLNINDQLSAGGHTYGLTWNFPSVLLARTGAALINYSESIATVNLN